MKEIALAVGLPLGAIGLTIRWKTLLRPKRSIEDYVALLEVLIAALVFSVSVLANDTGDRSINAQHAASIAGLALAISLVFAGALVKRAYDPDETFSWQRAAILDILGLAVFVIVYWAINAPSQG
jgi:dipeptide/tripeptide permease